MLPWQPTLIPAASLVHASSPSSYPPSSTYLYASSCPHVHSIPSSHSYYITTSSPCSSKRSPSIPHSRLPSAALVLSSSCSNNSPPSSRRRPKSSPQRYALPFTSTRAKRNLFTGCSRQVRPSVFYPLPLFLPFPSPFSEHILVPFCCDYHHPCPVLTSTYR
jgi:hypothetical protein